MSELLPMSKREISRAQVLEQLVRKQIKQGQAAQRLGVSVRQVKRLKRAYQRGGRKRWSRKSAVTAATISWIPTSKRSRFSG